MNLAVAGVLASMTQSIGSRHQAAEILHKVAEAGSWGGFPSDVTCREVGEALERICLNAPVPNAFNQVMRGWKKAARRRARRFAQV